MANYILIPCSEVGQEPIKFTYIVDDREYSLNSEEVWLIENSVGDNFCGVVSASTSENASYTAVTIHTDCSTCAVSAGTPYETCLVCCPCESGSTITSVSTPHPTWSNQYGTSVIQSNMVLLGGNGLNS
jgi:hypothetical protein